MRLTHRVQRVGRSPVQTVEQMPVRVESGPNICMAKPRLYHLGMLAGRDQESSVSVPQVVEAESLEPRSIESRPPHAMPEVRGPQRATLR